MKTHRPATETEFRPMYSSRFCVPPPRWGVGSALEIRCFPLQPRGAAGDGFAIDGFQCARLGGEGKPGGDAGGCGLAHGGVAGRITGECEERLGERRRVALGR